MNAINVFHGDVSRDLLLKEKEFEKLRMSRAQRGRFLQSAWGTAQKQSDLESARGACPSLRRIRGVDR